MENKSDWNEIQFLSWPEFKQMAPAIIQLEVRRIDRMLKDQTIDVDGRNLLVKTRFELKQFIKVLGKADRDAVKAACVSHLQSALLNVSIKETLISDKHLKAFGYIADRINYVLKRIELLY